MEGLSIGDRGGTSNAAIEAAENKQAIRHQWKIEGMDCPSCASKVEKAVMNIDGIISARVAFATERLLLLVDKNADVENKVKHAINKAGFSLVESRTRSSSEQQSSKKTLITCYGSIIIFTLLVFLAAATNTIRPDYANLIFSAATLWGLFPVARRAWGLILSGSPFSIETLMSIAAIGALFLGETAEAAMVLLLFMVGEHLESFASGRARQGIQKLMALTPDTAIKINPDGSKSEVLAETLLPGDRIEILPGQRLPVDASLLSNTASFDESALTGESVPVEHESGSRVLAGSLLVDKVVQFKVLSEPGENAIDRIITLIEEAEESKAPIERFIDRFSRWYTPAMIVLAALVATVPPLFVGLPWGRMGL